MASGGEPTPPTGARVVVWPPATPVVMTAMSPPKRNARIEPAPMPTALIRSHWPYSIPNASCASAALRREGGALNYTNLLAHANCTEQRQQVDEKDQDGNCMHFRMTIEPNAVPAVLPTVACGERLPWRV